MSVLASGLVCAHEFGHNFGAEHDSELPASGGAYLMYPYASDGSEANNDDFSSMSVTR